MKSGSPFPRPTVGSSQLQVLGFFFFFFLPTEPSWQALVFYSGGLLVVNCLSVCVCVCVCVVKCS